MNRQVSIVLPTSGVWALPKQGFWRRISTARLTYTPAALGVIRSAIISVVDGSGNVLFSASSGAIAANGVPCIIQWAVDVTTLTQPALSDFDQSFISVAIPVDLWLPPGCGVRLEMSHADLADLAGPLIVVSDDFLRPV